MTRQDDTFLDDILAQARSQQPTPSQDLIARVLADAAAEQAAILTPIAAPVSRGQRFFDILGGWTGFGGLITAGMAGIWIGLAPQVPLESLAAGEAVDTIALNLWPEDSLFDVSVETDG